MSGYVFLGNSTKPTEERQKNRERVSLDNVGRPCLKAALNMGYEVYLGINRENPEELECEELPIHMYDSHTYRSIFAFGDNRIAFNNLRNIVKEKNIEVIHCNTPIGGMIGRLVGRKYHVKKVIYTVHGFHFYKGAPLINKTFFKWAEKIMAHWTDAIITMNQEDYKAARKFQLRRGGKVYKVHGVGITLDDYENVDIDKNKIRCELNLKENDIVCISAGDLVRRKNYEVAIRAIALLKKKNIHYLICGIGSEKEKMENLVKKLNIEKQIHFLGLRTDVKQLLLLSDIFLFTSLQEGLPRSLMEAMACGLPCVVSKIRGNTELIKHGEGGYLCGAIEKEEFAKALKILSDNAELREKMGRVNKKNIKAYDVSVVEKEIEEIYREILGNRNVEN